MHPVEERLRAVVASGLNGLEAWVNELEPPSFGVVARANCAQSCPIAKFVQHRTGRSEVYISTIFAQIRWIEGGFLDGVSVPLPDELQRFVRIVDDAGLRGQQGHFLRKDAILRLIELARVSTEGEDPISALPGAGGDLPELEATEVDALLVEDHQEVAGARSA